MNGSEVIAPTADASSEVAPSASTQVGTDSEPPSTFDELPTPEGWDGLKLIDPYSDECVITFTYDRNSDPPVTEANGSLQFSCGGGPSVTAYCQAGGITRNMWSCGCSGQERSANSTIEFKYNGLTEIDACRITGALCVTKLPAEMAREQETCTPRTPTLYPDSCLHTADCVKTVTLGDMVLDQTLKSDSICIWGDDDVVQCSCTGTLHSQIGFTLSPAMTEDSCEVATSVCDDGVDAGSLGAIECAIDPQLSFADELWCDEVYECAQPALVDGRAVDFLGPQLRARCDHDTSSDSWECSCGGYEFPTSLPAPDATTACQLNLQRCLELLSGDIREW